MWHDRTLSRNISSNNITDGLAAVISKLDNLGHDIKNLKENFHVIQVGCQICEGPYLDNEFPLNEEVKPVEEEESVRRSTKMEEWIKKLQENTEINTRNQSTSLKNLETQIEQLTKKLYSRTINEAPSSSIEQCASVNVMPRNIFEYLRLANLRNTNMLVEMADMTKHAPL
nr:zinc knuckle CX2CX4HX4C [Tanacetum cinerariifolium]